MEFSGQNTKRVLRNFFRNMTNIISLIIIRNILKPNLESKGRMVLCHFFLFLLNVDTYKNKNSAKKTHTPFTQIHELLTFCHNWFYHIFLNHMRLSCKYHALLLLENLHFRDFPGSPGVKTLQFQCREHRFDPWLGNFPACHAVQPPKTCIS